MVSSSAYLEPFDPTPRAYVVSTPEIFTGRSEGQKVGLLAAPFGAQGRTRPERGLVLAR
jgi:hypothetical protein